MAYFFGLHAGVAQLAEQLICNQQVISSSLIAGSKISPPAAASPLRPAEKPLKEWQGGAKLRDG
jgi:hypothetical protein